MRLGDRRTLAVNIQHLVVVYSCECKNFEVESRYLSGANMFEFICQIYTQDPR
jgi:hypothetical protein